MQNFKRTFVMLSAVGLLSVPAFAAAQDPQPQPPSQPSQPAPAPAPRPEAAPVAQAPSEAPSAKDTVKGELVSVDDAAKSITIKDETGAEQKFTYDDKTDVSGAREGVAGLATRAGSKVTVKFKDGAAGKLATKIEVQRAPGAQQ